MPTAVPGETEVLTSLRGAVELARRNIVTHSVDLVVGEPQGLVLGVEVHPHRIAHATGEYLAVLAVAVHPDNAHHPDLVIQGNLFLGGHIERVTQCDVELVVRADPTGPGGVVEALFFNRDQLPLGHDRCRGNIRTLIEKIGCRECQYAILFGDIKHTVRRKAQAIRNLETDRRCEHLHLIGDTALGAVGDGPHASLARTDENHARIGANCHVTRVRHDRIQIDLEARRQLDLLEIGLERRCACPALRHRLDVQRCPCALEPLQFLHVVLGLCGNAAGYCRAKQRESGCKLACHVCLLMDFWKKTSPHSPPSGCACTSAVIGKV